MCVCVCVCVVYVKGWVECGGAIQAGCWRRCIPSLQTSDKKIKKISTKIDKQTKNKQTSKKDRAFSCEAVGQTDQPGTTSLTYLHICTLGTFPMKNEC